MKKFDFEKKPNLFTKLIVIVILILAVLYLVDKFFDAYTLQAPIKIQFLSPVKKRSILYRENEKVFKKGQILSKFKVSDNVVAAGVDSYVLQSANNSSEERRPTASNPLLEQVYEQTRIFESNKGTNSNPTATHNYCKSIGLVNEIGYLPNGNRKFCFKNEEEQKETFIKWMRKRLEEGFTLKEAICYYVTGYRQPMCKRTIDMGM